MTGGPKQTEIVTLAVYLLDGHLGPVDMEDIAMKVDELAPKEFRWHKYPDQVDLVRVRSCLYHAAQRRSFPPYLRGSEMTGWTLTPAGLTWIREDGQRLLEGVRAPVRSRGSQRSLDDARKQRERSRVQQTQAWQQWQQGTREIAVRDAAEVFRIDSYAVGRTLHLKIARVRDLFDEDPDLGPFITAAASVVEHESKEKE